MELLTIALIVLVVATILSAIKNWNNNGKIIYKPGDFGNVKDQSDDCLTFLEGEADKIR